MDSDDEEATTAMTVRLSNRLHDRLRREAFDSRTPASEIVRSGVERELDRRIGARAEGGR